MIALIRFSQGKPQFAVRIEGKNAEDAQQKLLASHPLVTFTCDGKKLCASNGGSFEFIELTSPPPRFLAVEMREGKVVAITQLGHHSLATARKAVEKMAADKGQTITGFSPLIAGDTEYHIIYVIACLKPNHLL